MLRQRNKNPGAREIVEGGDAQHGHKERIRQIEEGNVTVALLRLRMPLVVSMLVTALYNLVDTCFRIVMLGMFVVFGCTRPGMSGVRTRSF